MSLLTVVVPCYNEEPALPIFYEEMSKTMDEFKDVDKDLSFELLFIDDGSKDKTLSVIKDLADKDDRVHYVSFSRNFGKEAGIYAGLENSHGDYVVIMDADLQDPPSLLPDMYRAVSSEGYDSAATRRVVKHIYILFHILSHYGLSQDIKYSSLCYTVGPCFLYFLYIIVCTISLFLKFNLLYIK